MCSRKVMQSIYLVYNNIDRPNGNDENNVNDGNEEDNEDNGND